MSESVSHLLVITAPSKPRSSYVFVVGGWQIVLMLEPALVASVEAELHLGYNSIVWWMSVEELVFDDGW